MCEQTCADCRGVGYQLVGFTGTMPRFGDSLCPTCDGTGTIQRTGPYRLADCTWSDEVDRKNLLRNLRFNEANPPRVSVSKVGVSRTWEAYRIAPYLSKQFPTYTEAIAYADRMARTNQGENK